MADNLKYTANDCTSKTWNDIAPHDACQSHNTVWGEEVLYQWGAAMNGSITEGAQGLCPDGWYIPTDAEWTILIDYLGGSEVAGTKLKAKTPIWDGNDTVGFNGKPAGSLLSADLLYDVGYFGYWWTSSISNSAARINRLNSDDSYVDGDASSQIYGNSVRCLLGQ